MTNFPGVLFVRNGKVLLPKGLRMVWRLEKTEKERP